MRPGNDVLWQRYLGMPRYFFHLRDDDGLVPDTEGSDLPDAEAAKREGQASALEMLAEDIRAQRKIDHRRIEVLTENGAVIAVYQFRDLLH